MTQSKILSRILNNEDVPASEIQQILLTPSVEKRWRTNFKIAEAYCYVKKFEEAVSYITRAFSLSGYNGELFDLFMTVHKNLKNTEPVREGLKRLYIKEADAGNIEIASKLFEHWLYSYVKLEKRDKYVYDQDILNATDRLVDSYNVKFINKPEKPEEGKIRIAYLIKDGTIKDGTLMKVMRHFAVHHDKSKYDIRFYFPESEAVVNNSEGGKAHVKLLESYGWKVFAAPNAKEVDQKLISLAHSINRFNPHIMVTTQGLADFKHYFVSLLKPAPVLLGLVLGNALEFSISHKFNHAIAWPQQIQMASPVDTSVFNMEVELPNKENVVTVKPDAFGVLPGQKILMSVGRFPKFQNREYWQTIVGLLTDNPDFDYVVIGPKEAEIPFLNELEGYFSVKNRIHLMGWIYNYYNYLASADLVLSTYPMGGGIVMMDTMSLSIPILTFECKLTGDYDYSNQTTAGILIDIPELILPRNNFEMMKERITDLLRNNEKRKSLGKRCKEAIVQINGNPGRMVKSCENIYSECINNFYKEGSANNSVIISEQEKNSVNKLLEAGELLLASNENYEKAIEIFNMILSIEPENAGARNNIGIAYWNMNKKYIALNYFIDAFNLDESNETYLLNYAEAVVELDMTNYHPGIIEKYLKIKNAK
ncbi:MAG: glycosyltransferase family 4 protein [Melioribacteraceae bacterium]|nr:glycosyltransferase family 4 protein [Melioribacteraceae bacterium]